MNIQNSLALAVIVLLAPCALGDNNINDNGYNGIEQEYSNSLRKPTTISRCVSSGDCGPEECSVMGMQRYSEPECRPKGDLGAPCRMYDAGMPENKTLHFPHMIMECSDVYMQFCPCASGLVCSDSECRPQESFISGELEVEEDDNQKASSLSYENYFRQQQYQNRRPFPWALGRFH